MLWKTHVVGGVNTLWLFRVVPNSARLDQFPVLAACAAFGACLPDLDASSSKIRSLKIAGVRPFQPVGAAANFALGHRGFLHSPLALACLGLGLSYTTRWVGVAPAVAVWLGYASHLALDAMTPAGIPLGVGGKHKVRLLPKHLRIPTGSLAETVMLILLLLGLIALTLGILNPGLVNLQSFLRLLANRR